MSSIKDIGGLNPDVQKMLKNERSTKASSNSKTAKSDEKVNSAEIKDSATISDQAKELLATESETERFVSSIKNAETTSRNEIVELKTAVNSGKYSDPKVIDKIVEKLLDLPNFIG